jgi:hypothetical protein
MKKSSNTIGNRNSDLPVCRAMPQPLRHRMPSIEHLVSVKIAAGIEHRYLMRQIWREPSVSNLLP